MADTAEQTRFDLVRQWDEDRRQRGWWHSIELRDGTVIPGVCSLESLKDRIGRFPIPEDLSGKRVLDIGAWDGWFSFEMERRGADVLAIDNWDNPRFHEARSLLNSRVDYKVIDVYELTPERVGRFDIVLFMGVLYHLKHPLLALERVCALTTDMAAVDSFVLREEHRPGEDVDRLPVMEFYETDEFGGQTDNWCGPSLSCLAAFCRTAGFARVEFRARLENSACFACHRRWEPPAPGSAEGPAVLAVWNNLHGGLNFSSSRDEQVFAWFRSPGPLTVSDVQPEVGGYGVHPVAVIPAADGEWHAVFKLPPGLTPGWHDVQLRVAGSGPGDGKRVAVDVPLRVGAIRITGLSDGTTWTSDQLNRSHGDVLTLWISGLPENVDATNLAAAIGATRLSVEYIGADQDGVRQVNLKVPDSIGPGPTQIAVSVGGTATATADFAIVEAAS